MKKGLSANALKYIAVAAMLIDHIAWSFVPFGSFAGQLMHVIGRLTAPIMCYCIAEGYYHTRNVKKYALRLGIFAVISHFPFMFFETGKLLCFTRTSVIFTLLCGLLALWAWNEVKNPALKLLAIFVACVLAFKGDWSFWAVLWILIFGINHDNFPIQAKHFTVISIVMVITEAVENMVLNLPFYKDFFGFGVCLALVPISLYNKERGKKNAFNKWFFYIFYPLHLLILGILKYYII